MTAVRVTPHERVLLALYRSLNRGRARVVAGAVYSLWIHDTKRRQLDHRLLGAASASVLSPFLAAEKNITAIVIKDGADVSSQ